MPVSGTTITSSTDVVQAQIEKVSDALPELFATTSTFATMIKRDGRAEKMSEKLYRIPFVKYFGGNYGTFDGNNGTMNNGSGPVVDKLTAGYRYIEYGFEWSMAAADTSATSDQSKLNTVNYILGGIMKQLLAYDETAWFGDGTGKVTNACSTGTSTTMTFAAATDTLGIRRLREGMHVRIYDASAVDFMASDNQIASIDYANKKITFTAAASATPAVGDYLVFTGVTANPPASFASTYPVSSLTADSFLHGLYYFNDYSSSNYVLGQLKSSVPQLLPISVDASSSTITTEHGQLIVDQCELRRDKAALSGMIGIASQAQRAVIQSATTAITSKFITGNSVGDSVDLRPKNNRLETTFDFCGFTMDVSKHQYTDRIDFVKTANWGRAIVRDPGFLKNNGGGYMFEGRASTGALKASQIVKVVQAFDWFNVDPGASAVIYSGAVPSGY